MKYVIFNVRDSDWNLFGTKYRIIVTDPKITSTLGPERYKVREVNDPMPADFITSYLIEAIEDKPEYHQSAKGQCLVWILRDTIERNDGEVNTIEFI